MIEIKRYTPKDAAEWNNFVWKSRQGTFLFDRNYMDYHQDRFHDHSLMFYYKGRLYAILPANETADEDKKILYSHQGLTYGGLLTCSKVTAEVCIDIFQALKDYLLQNDFQLCIYKAMPWIYQSIPSEEDLYALSYIGKAKLIAREISTTIFLNAPLRFSEQRRRGIKKAVSHGLSVGFTKFPKDITDFWDLLDKNLWQRHNTEHKVRQRMRRGISILINFLLINFLWIFFRMPSVGDAFHVIGKIFTEQDMNFWVFEKFILLFILMVFAKDLIVEVTPGQNPFHHPKLWVRWCTYVVVTTSIFLFGVFDSGQFIYAGF